MIVLQDLCKSFDPNVPILDHFTLTVNNGEILAIIGRSGVGKTILLKCILGLIPIDSGTINYQGKISMVFQKGALFDSFPIWKNIAFSLLNKGMPKKIAQNYAREALESVSLSWKIANLYPTEVSGGMHRRIAVARALILKPDIILFDEPTTELDPVTAYYVDSLIKKTCKENNITAILVTHDMTSIRRIADRVVMLNHGRNAWDAPMKELDQTNNPLIKQFVSPDIESDILCK